MAQELIGYEPTVEIRDGVARFVDWYEVYRDWYAPLVERDRAFLNVLPSVEAIRGG